MENDRLMVEQHDAPYVENKLIVKFAPQMSRADLSTLLSDTGYQVEKALISQLNIWLLAMDPRVHESTEVALTSIRQYSEVLYAQLDHLVTPRVALNDPNDPDFISGGLLNMHNTGQMGGTVDADIDAPEAWDRTTGGATALGDQIVVAVVDGGGDIYHQDLTDNIWINEHEISGNGLDDDNNGYIDDVNGWNAYEDNGSMIINDVHGTHVAGIVGAKGNNAIYV